MIRVFNLQPRFTLALQMLTKGMNSMLDIGCHFGEHTKNLNIERKLFMDIERQPNAPEPFWEFNVSNLRQAAPTCGTFELVIALDLIEHLSKDEGNEFLSAVELVANKRIIIFTPLHGFMVNVHKNPTHHDHKSGWEPEEFTSRGYEVVVDENFHPSLNCGIILAWKNLSTDIITAEEFLKELFNGA